MAGSTPPGRVKVAYLVFYNSLQTLGWLLVLVQSVLALSKGSPSSVYPAAGPPARVFQLLASVEILHAATGLVPSGVLNAFMQWLGRSNVLFVIVAGVSQVQSSPFCAAMLICWALSEIVRYPFYALTLLDACPPALTWLRYSAFLPLYPAGVVSEMALIVLALPRLRSSGMLSISMPNKLNWAFDYSTFMKLVLGLYPLLWWQLYATLLGQRAKRLRSTRSPASTKLE